ncbi:ParB/RepB/Spo0J family partition protein [Ochrobactrum teleogrylli]|uniref:ParB/RepB/Spo0J family partition protein n=1 Tax=Ochrobactrum teleogrylli TaxID=2479765 RepID=A0ABY2Y7Q8_9HYPH|nr:ParB/RepB/Spo0J family partition protein [[Ochrobactrum] teleogrylli]TNV17768.1 ParB/RepB/Spo0J family partition protein [[Ochrobactrum] teleogrylli]
MAEFKRIAIVDIVVGDRLRQVEEDHAQAIALSIAEHGLLNPITVRFTPNAKGGKYTLIAGAHRLRAVVINGDEEIDVLVVEADKTEAALQEVTENLFRNELSVIDRAIFVQKYRELWEEKHGEIKGGRPKQDQLDPIISGGFSAHVADRMGVSVPSIKRLNLIAQNIHPDLRAAIRGTDIADNQSELLKLAKLDPAMQRRTAIAFREEGDLKRALSLIGDTLPPSAVNKQEKIFSDMVDLWSRANTETKARFQQHIGLATPEEDAA